MPPSFGKVLFPRDHRWSGARERRVASTGSGTGEALRFEILGPLRAWLGDQELVLGPNKQRAVLATLLVNANKSVSTPQIVAAVWLDDPPHNGANVVQKYVAGLRRVLEPGREPRSPGQLLTRTQSGYLLRIAPGGLDAEVFAALEHQAHTARDEHRLPEATDRLTRALDLWHGEVLAGLAGPVFDSARLRLGEVRAVALETLAEIEVAAGRHRPIVPELFRLVADFPFREQPRFLLMLALSQAGRRAEALTAYRDYRQHLADELGIEPGERVRDLHQRILQSEPSRALLAQDAKPQVVTPGAATARDPGSQDADTTDVRPPDVRPREARPADPAGWPAERLAGPALAMPPGPTPAARWGITAGTPEVDGPRWVWWLVKIAAVAVPLVTLGLGTWAVIAALAAFRAAQGKRDAWVNAIASIGYACAAVAVVTESLVLGFTRFNPILGILLATVVIAQFGGAVHAALLIRAPARDETPGVSILLRVIAAIVPIVTIGFGGWAVVGYYAARRRSRWLGLASAGYLAVAFAMVVNLYLDDGSGAVGTGLVTLLWLGMIVGSAAHGAALDPDLHRRPSIPY
jgi:DNA-binding SARP family transcriptional activator